MHLPWVPLFSVKRSNKVELTIHGLLAIVDQAGKAIFTTGDTQACLWTRSVLKPWQLAAQLPELRQAYPDLDSEHQAIMASSHNGEPKHMRLLEDLLQLADVHEADLKCPACLPLALDARGSAHAPRQLFNPCSGKHLSYLMSLKAGGKRLDTYLDPASDHFARLRQLLARILDRDGSTFDATTDGCLMPNYGLRATDIARLYARLGAALPGSGNSAGPNGDPEAWVSKLMFKHPDIVGGTGRLDTRITSGALASGLPPMVAKEGADGLLAVAMGTQRALGVVIKISCGWQPQFLEKIFLYLLEQLGLTDRSPMDADGHIQSEFYFQVPPVENGTR